MASNQVDLGDYTFIRHKDKLLGAGGFGRVWSGERKTETEGLTDQNVAIKEIEINVRTNTFIDREQTLMRELKRTPHDNVIRFIDSVLTDFYMYFIIELCTLGDLSRFMKTQTENTFSLCSKVMHCTSAGLRHLHKKIRICHRDIKPANVLVTETSSDINFKIADLGLARPIDDTSSTRFYTGRIGTWGWMAPEMPVTPNASHQYSYPADVFSLGLLFESVFRYQPGGHLEYHEEQGTYLAAWLRTVDSLGQSVQELDLGFHGGRFVTQAMHIIQKMLRFSTSDRCDIDQVCTEIQNIQDDINKGPVTSDDTAIHVKNQAETRSHDIVNKNKSPSGASPGDAAAAVPSTSAEATMVKPKKTGFLSQLRKFGRKLTFAGQPKQSTQDTEASTVQAEGGVVSQMRELSIAGQPPHSTPGCDLELRKLGHITLPVTGTASLFFVQANFLVGFDKSPDLYYFEYQEEKYKLMWHKAIPQEVKYTCWKFMSPRGEFYLQSINKEVCLYDQHLSLITTLSSPGVMRSLLPGGERALVDNCASPSTQTEGLRLSVSPVSNLHDIHHQLDVPTDGPYAREDVVRACGLEDGRLAVVVVEKPFCDLYDVSGRHTGRTELPGGAGHPSCTSAYVLVPLWNNPTICLLDWAGNMRILHHTELGLKGTDRCCAVSPVDGGRLSVWVTGRTHDIYTYEVCGMN